MTPDCAQRHAACSSSGTSPMTLISRYSRRACLAAEIVDEARRPVGIGELSVERRLVGVAGLRETVEYVFGHRFRSPRWRASARAGRSGRGPRTARRRRSTNGEPNTPARDRCLDFALQRVLDRRIVDGRARCGGVDARRRRHVRGHVGIGDVDARRRRTRDTAPARPRAASAGSRAFAHSTMRAGACDAIGNADGMRKSAMPWKRALRSKSRRE